MDIVFFTDEESKKKISLGVGNIQLESWFLNQLESYDEFEIVNTIENTDDVSNQDAIVLLRKNKSGGIEDIPNIVHKFIDTNPKGYVLFIAGNEDEMGINLISKLKEITNNLFVASVSSGQLGPDVVETSFKNMLTAMVKEDNTIHTEENVAMKEEICEKIIYEVKSAKGGCGATTISTHIAAMSQKKGRKTLLVETKGSLTYLSTPHELTVIDIEEFNNKHFESYDTIVFDDVTYNLKENISLKRLLIIDGSTESIEKSKELSFDHLVYNQACIEIISEEIIKHELKLESIITIPNDRALFLQKAATGELHLEQLQNLI
ncbi:MAG: hypothetical protein ACK4M9_22515 [Anaerobacillus sp.]|uniref:hypothetical protein n=1 Tax=Anaerobacillus sp. TaxID=1872506 RepID=UPI00391BD7AB